MAQPDFAAALETALVNNVAGFKSMGELNRLSGGASQETYAFEAQTDKGTIPLILRRAPGGTSDRSGAGEHTGALAVEAKTIIAARKSGVPAPDIIYVTKPEDGAGEAYVMERIEGETLARRILRDKEFDSVRPKLAYQCGQAFAQIHAADVSGIPELKLQTGPEVLEAHYERYKNMNQPKPVMDLAFKWLRERLKEPRKTVLVHGDFRNGNLMFQPEKGLVAVLDWELIHLGDPLEDLAWVCVNSWRFGNTNKVVGGFGDVEEMLKGYRDAGGDDYTVEDVRTYEVLGSLKWGLGCMGMYEAFRSGYDRSVERAAIGRRVSENEIDLVNLLIG